MLRTSIQSVCCPTPDCIRLGLKRASSEKYAAKSGRRQGCTPRRLLQRHRTGRLSGAKKEIAGPSMVCLSAPSALPTLMDGAGALHPALPALPALHHLPLTAVIHEEAPYPPSCPGQPQPLEDSYAKGVTAVGGYELLERRAAFHLPVQDGIFASGEGLPLPHDGFPSGSGVRERGRVCRRIIPLQDDALLLRKGSALPRGGLPSRVDSRPGGPTADVRPRGPTGRSGGQTRRRTRGGEPHQRGRGDGLRQAGRPRPAEPSVDAAPADVQRRRRLRRRRQDAPKAATLGSGPAARAAGGESAPRIRKHALDATAGRTQRARDASVGVSVGGRPVGDVRKREGSIGGGLGSDPASSPATRAMAALAPVASCRLILIECGEVPLGGAARRLRGEGARGGVGVRRLAERTEEVPETDSAFGGSGSLGGGEEGGEGGRPSRGWGGAAGEDDGDSPAESESEDEDESSDDDSDSCSSETEAEPEPPVSHTRLPFPQGTEAGELIPPSYYGVPTPSQTTSRQRRSNPAASSPSTTLPSRTSQETRQTSACDTTNTHDAGAARPWPDLPARNTNPLVAWGRSAVQTWRTAFGDGLCSGEARTGNGPGGGTWLGHSGQGLGEGGGGGQRPWFRATGSTRYAWYVIAMRAMINGVGLTLGRL